MTFIGIDPGKSGCVVIESAPGKVEVYPMPLIGNDLDVRGIGEIFADLARTGHTSDCFAMLEKQQCYPKQGGVSNFTTGYGYGVLVAMLTASHIPFDAVTPQAWKKHFGLLVETKKPAKKTACSAPSAINEAEIATAKKTAARAKNLASQVAKAASIRKAQQLFPGVNLVPPGCRTPSDGIAEALLIMEYGKREKRGE